MSLPFSADRIHLGAIDLVSGTADPTAGAGVNAPVGSLYMRTSGDTYQKMGSADTAWVIISMVPSVFGDASDGDLTVAGTTTLTRDTMYNNLTIQNGGVFIPAQFRTYVRGTLTINAGGAIRQNGASAVGSGGAAGASVGSWCAAAAAGGASNVGAGSGGGASGTAPAGFTGAGGIGGTGTGGAAGAAGAVTNTAATRGLPRSFPFATSGMLVSGTYTTITTGSGGGGGAGTGAVVGGGGGAGAGGILIMARSLINNGAIEAIGGNGFSTATAGAGGGGGGGGGFVLLNTHYFEGTAPSVAGGTGGTGGGGGGGSGANGSAGLVIMIQS